MKPFLWYVSPQAVENFRGGKEKKNILEECFDAL